MESKTTPGPWEWVDNGGRVLLWGRHGMRPIVLDGAKVLKSGDVRIADIRMRDAARDVMRPLLTFDRLPADARLIEKAPEMYEALRLFAEHLANPEGDEIGLLAVQTDCYRIIRYVEEGDD